MRRDFLNVYFKLDDSRAFVGTRNQKGARLSLAQVTQDRKKQTVVLNFDPPVTPGQTITIGLRPVQNPRISGVYLFGITVYPWGEKSHGQFRDLGDCNSTAQEDYLASLDLIFPKNLCQSR